MDFETMILKHEPAIKPLEYNGYVIDVYTYIDIKEYHKMIDEILADSVEGTGYNPCLLYAYSAFYITKYFTDIEFGEDTDKLAAAGELLDTDLFEMILNTLGMDKYEDILDDINSMVEARTEEHRSLFYTGAQLIKELASGIEQMQGLVENFDPQKYQAVIDFATAANGGRPIQG